jgi:hypothetical protein
LPNSALSRFWRNKQTADGSDTCKLTVFTAHRCGSKMG